MRPIARSRPMVLAGAACVLCCLAVPVWAQNEVLQRKTLKSGKAGHEMTLGGHVRIDRNCLSIGVPRIDLEQPPAHGIMCLRPADVPLQYLVGNAPSSCLGRKAAGVRVFYRSYDGYTGKDEARYTVRFPRSQVNVDVDLTIVPDERPPISGVPPADGVPAEEAQTPGPMPACAALES
jgi:hypothetical protein